jgi:hypothetical protein
MPHFRFRTTYDEISSSSKISQAQSYTHTHTYTHPRTRAYTGTLHTFKTQWKVHVPPVSVLINFVLYLQSGSDNKQGLF